MATNRGGLRQPGVFLEGPGMTLRAALAFACLVLAGCGQAPQSSGGQQANSPSEAMQTATQAPQLAARAARFENHQIQAAQIAQQSAASRAAKAFTAATLGEHQERMHLLH